MSDAATASALPTKSQVMNWQSAHLDDAASRWRASAVKSDGVFDQLRANIVAPGGTQWSGTAKDAALQRVAVDIILVGKHGAVQRSAADIAERGAGDVRSAQQATLNAIHEAEADEFSVTEDLSVIDSRSFDPETALARHRAALEHGEYIVGKRSG